MSKKILGLDIRHNAVSAVLVRNSIKGNSIEAHMHVSLSDQNEADRSITDLIEMIVKKIDLSGCICVAAIPADLISYRNIQVPFAEQKKIRQILPFELESMLPFPVDDLIIDFHSFKVPDQDDRTDIIAAFVEKKRIDSYLDILASFNIQPKLVTAGSYPLAVCMAGLSDTAENWLFIDIDSRENTLIGVASGQICIIRSLPAGSVASSMTESICTDIQRTLSAFEEISLLDFNPDRIFITGGGIESSNLERDMSDISQRLGYPVQGIDLIHKTDIILKRDLKKPWNPGRMDNALALALIEIEGFNSLNFRKGPFMEKKFWAENKRMLIKTGILTAFVLLLGFFYFMTDFYYMKKKIDHLDNQIIEIFKTALPEVKTIVDPLHQMRIELKEVKKKSVFSAETKKNIKTIDILEQISRLIPEEIETNFTRLVIGAESVLITGDTDTFNAVDDMKNKLEQAALFTKVTISSANMEKSGNRVRFKLKIRL